MGDDRGTGFSAFARAGNGCFGGSASLYVREGALEVVPGFALGRASGVERVVQQTGQVQLFHPRLAAPWVNTTVMVRGGGVTAGASVWVTSRRRLKRALGRAGFEVSERRTWTYRGDDLVQGGRAGVSSDEGMPAG